MEIVKDETNRPRESASKATVQPAGSILLAATPIGDTADASPRLVKALQEADLIGAEDTRKLLNLCGRLGIKTTAKIIALHEHNENERAKKLLEAAAAGQRVMVVSDAGMPTVSDPGFRVASQAAAAQIKVSALPGPSAVLTALAVSGLPSDRFCFDGFVPRKESDRRKFFAALKTEPRTMIFFDSPKRVHETFGVLEEVFGADRKAVLCRELTKTYEEILRGTVSELKDLTEGEIRGEITLVIAGAEKSSKDPADYVAQVKALAAEGMRLKDAAAQVAEATGLRKNELYQAALAAK
ncbi:16S rRNA (cytidine(1402)-2'-O)-methyltransferase [Gleimia sp. 6138-11-ORH1]|uniref:16S rRNA (cytidine(1402)-2'-O)-methyltransferase n=1 Tax=Gleimia sp. 6138-11-ORH1 TaxID=2973937 RepID=UPI002166DAE9|nr:16S rRNA (cytidine(1402)-2'-O)-methyltransferase [Gleimia sp. 6138-11-ORH1]MCS4485171.1 16S rRNA (cytidine(1402)-2'-O)-methyltransferase [Gleimia sp. 6138-11-ORH1]